MRPVDVAPVGGCCTRPAPEPKKNDNLWHNCWRRGPFFQTHCRTAPVCPCGPYRYPAPRARWATPHASSMRSAAQTHGGAGACRVVARGTRRMWSAHESRAQEIVLLTTLWPYHPVCRTPRREQPPGCRPRIAVLDGSFAGGLRAGRILNNTRSLIESVALPLPLTVLGGAIHPPLLCSQLRRLAGVRAPAARCRAPKDIHCPRCMCYPPPPLVLTLA